MFNFSFKFSMKIDKIDEQKTLKLRLMQTANQRFLIRKIYFIEIR